MVFTGILSTTGRGMREQCMRACLGLLGDDACFAAGEGLQRAPQLTIFYTAGFFDVLQRQCIRVVEQHQHHRLHHTTVVLHRQ